MSGILLWSTVLITLALVFYSIGVWSERVSRYLKPWHVVMFWVGLFFDFSGTVAMELIKPGFDWWSIHTVTGQLALWLMFGHAVWATATVRRGDETALASFHRYSLMVWAFWLVPYLGGAVLGMT